MIPASPVRAKLHRPVHERKEKRSYTPEQLRAFTQHVPEEYKLLTNDVHLYDPEEAATSEAIEAMAKVYFEVQEVEGVN